MINKHVWSSDVVEDWAGCARQARAQNKMIHRGRVFGIMVLKGVELPEVGKRRTYKYRVVFQGNTGVDQGWPAAIFQDLGSPLASMEAAKLTDYYACIGANDLQPADAVQYYV